MIEDGKNRGIMIDVIKELCKAQGIQLQLNFVSDTRIYKSFDMGTTDATFEAIEWSSDPKKYYWSSPIVTSEDVLVVRSEDKGKYSSIEQLYGKNLGAIGTFAYPTLDSLFDLKKITRVDATREKMMFEMLRKKRTDAFVTNRYVALHYIKNTPGHKKDFVISDITVDRAFYRILFNKRERLKIMRDKLNREIEKMKKDGRLERILNKYLH